MPPEAEHPGVPDDKAQRNFTYAAASCPHVEESAPAVATVRRCMDTSHDRGARATNQTVQQAAATMEETIDNVGAVPREVSADRLILRQRQSASFKSGRGRVATGQTRHGRHPRPEVAYPASAPRDRCVGTYPGGVQTRFAANVEGIRPDQALGPAVPSARWRRSANGR